MLVYPRLESLFSAEEKALVAAVAGFGAMAIAKLDLYRTAQAQAHELHQLLEISSELNSIGNQDLFMEALVVRAADFLGFGRCFIALLEAGAFHVRWGAEQGKAQRVDLPFPEGVASHALLNREVFWTDDPNKVRGANLEQVAKYQVRQILAGAAARVGRPGIGDVRCIGPRGSGRNFSGGYPAGEGPRRPGGSRIGGHGGTFTFLNCIASERKR